MLTLIIGVLTFILVVTCVVLILLILVQLPKKDAGAGLAFGSGAAEAVFGAGAGTPLAQITKYCASCFLGLALILAALNAHRSRTAERLIEQEAAKQQAAMPAVPTTPTTPAAQEGIPEINLQNPLTVTPNQTDSTDAEGEVRVEIPAELQGPETEENKSPTTSLIEAADPEAQVIPQKPLNPPNKANPNN